MNLRTVAFTALAVLAFGTSAVSLAQTNPAPQGTPPPPPVPVATSSALISTSPEPTTAASSQPSAADSSLPATTPTPVSSPSPVPTLEPSAEPSESPGPHGRRHRKGEGPPGPEPSASPSDTPEPPQFSTLDGVWEVALQPLTGARTTYSHLFITQKGDTLTGTWRQNAKTSLPFTGTFDGRLFKLTVTNGTSSELLSGYAENFMDMVGLYTDGVSGHPGTPFTAAHRKPAHERGVNLAP